MSVQQIPSVMISEAPAVFDHQSEAVGAICRVCARQRRTCCQYHDIYVTLGDCRRIQTITREIDFFEYRGCADMAYADQNDDPVWQQKVFRSDGSRRVLKQKSNGDCCFLTESGCRLALDVRPLICRLFPHYYTESGISTLWDTSCPITGQLPGEAIETGIAGVRRSEAERWHRLLYTEIQWEGQADENRIDL